MRAPPEMARIEDGIAFQRRVWRAERIGWALMLALVAAAILGLFGGGGVLALYGVGALVTTLIVVFDLFLPLWLAALIITVVLFAVAGVLALLGKKQVTKAVPPEPEAAIASVKADVDEVKQAVARERSKA